MTDLKEMFRPVESMPAPDLWNEAQIRSAQHDASGRAWRGRSRTPAAMVAVVAAGLAFLLLVRVFGSTGPASDVAGGGPTGTLAFESGDDVFVVQAGSGDVERLLGLHAHGSEGSLAFAWSPDGSMVAFTDEDSQGRRRLFVAASDGSGVHAMTTAALDVDDLAWSPDGAQIAFAASADGVGDIYAADAYGNGIQKLTRVARNGVDGATMPAWSPDGARIAFVWTRYNRASESEDQTIALIGADGGAPRPVTEGPVDESPAWSPKGDQIAFLAKNDQGAALKVVDPTARTERTVADLAPGDEFAWSPLDDALAFLDAGTGALLIAAPDGSVREVAAGSAFDGWRASGSLSWTLDGRWIGVAARSDSGGSRIFAVPVGGGDPIPVTSSEMPAHAPLWQPPGSELGATSPTSAGACDQGPWIEECPEANWARSVLVAAGLKVTQELPGAFIVQYSRGELLFWAMDPAHHEGVEPLDEELTSGDEFRVVQQVSGVIVHELRGRWVWTVHGLNVWVWGYSRNDPPADVIDSLVRASQSTPY